MGLNDRQRDDIRNFLLSRGLAFKPLLDEMSDHVACDLEILMDEGLTYEEAWKQTINLLPEDHFKQIQKETMETIDQRFTLSRVFTYIALGALFFSAIFKTMHLRGTSELILLSFLVLAISLVTGSISGIYFNRDKKGALRVMGVVVGTILVMTGYAFKVLHLAGADQIIILGVFTTMISMIINTIYVYNNASDHGNLFTFLHEKYTPGIERFLLLLLIPILVSKMVHIVLVFAAGLQLIALTWRYMEQDQSKRNGTNMISVMIAFTCIMIPMLGNVASFEIRLTAVMLFNFVGAFLSFRFEDSHKASSYLVVIPLIMFTATTLVKLNMLPSFSNNLPLNLVVLGLIGVGIFMSPKYSVMRTFMIMSTAYLIEL